MNGWEFLNIHFLLLFIFLCAFSILILILLYLVLTRAKIGIGKDGKWFYNYSPFFRRDQNDFLKKILEEYKMDSFKKSYFEESKNRRIGLCKLAIQELEEYFIKNNLNKNEISQKYDTDEEFRKDYDAKKEVLKKWRIELSEAESEVWHGDFSEEFSKIIGECNNKILN